MTRHAVTPPPPEDFKYYTELESYADRVRDATSFSISVVQNKGPAIRSSLMPIKMLPALVAIVELADSSKSPLSIWNHETNQIMMIAHVEICSVAFNLFP
jgi:hypothetical protein